jgi:hypothetical protein
LCTRCLEPEDSLSSSESFAKLYSRVGRNSKIAGIGFVVLAVVFLFLSVSDQFIVYEVDSIVAFLIAAVLLFRDPRAKVKAVVLDAIQLSSSEAIADLASEAEGYTYLPSGGSAEDVVVVPTSSYLRSRSKGEPPPSEDRITPPGRTLAMLFLRESGLTQVTIEGLAASLPRFVSEDLALAGSMDVLDKSDRVEVTLHGLPSICKPGSDGSGPASRGVVGCTVASFFAVLYSSASKRPVVLEECVRDEATKSSRIGLSLGPAARVTG